MDYNAQKYYQSSIDNLMLFLLRFHFIMVEKRDLTII